MLTIVIFKLGVPQTIAKYFPSSEIYINLIYKGHTLEIAKDFYF